MRRIIVFAIAFLTGLGGWAQTRMTVEAPRVVAVGDRFNLVFTINSTTSAVSDFIPPLLDDFHVLAGPNRSSLQRVSNVNGQRTSSTHISFTFTVEAKQEGKITIGSGSVTVDGKTIHNDPVIIEVIKGEALPQGNSSNDGQRTSLEVSDQDLFMRLEMSKTNVVKGEPITATLRLYTRVPIESFSVERFPTFNGFWSQEVEAPTNFNPVEENVGGRIYYVVLLRKYVLLPQQIGALRIDPAELMCMIQVRGGNQGQSLIDLFIDNSQRIRKRITTSAQTINVQPLPDGAPASFTGAVGTYNLSMHLDKDSINAHDATSVIVRIAGQGNINMVEAPKLKFPADFEVYDTRTTDNSRSGGNTITGSKQFEYPVIPRSAGTFTIEPVEFSYWDVGQKKYVTLKSNPLTLKVGRGVGGSSVAGHFDPGVSQMAVRNLGQDIRYIRTAFPAFVPMGALFLGSWAFWGLTFALLVGFIVAYRLLLRQRERNKDVVSVRSRKANKQAKMRLKTAGVLLKQNSYAKFYEEVHRALWGYIGDKLGVPPSDHDKEYVCTLLTERNAPQPLIAELSDLIETCEFARYAPAPEVGEMDTVYGRALQIITNIEQTIK